MAPKNQSISKTLRAISRKSLDNADDARKSPLRHVKPRRFADIARENAFGAMLCREISVTHDASTRKHGIITWWTFLLLMNIRSPCRETDVAENIPPDMLNRRQDMPYPPKLADIGLADIVEDALNGIGGSQ
jgi:hypothetical protein